MAFARGGQTVDQAVDLRFRPDVDAARRLIENDDPRIPLEPPGQECLLLIAAAERGDRLVGAAWPECRIGRSLLARGGVATSEARGRTGRAGRRCRYRLRRRANAPARGPAAFALPECRPSPALIDSADAWAARIDRTVALNLRRSDKARRRHGPIPIGRRRRGRPVPRFRRRERSGSLAGTFRHERRRANSSAAAPVQVVPRLAERSGRAIGRPCRGRVGADRSPRWHDPRRRDPSRRTTMRSVSSKISSSRCET